MKIQRRIALTGFLLVATSALSACSSNALPTLTRGAVPGQQTARAGKTQRVTVRIFVPRRHRRDTRSMRPYFVANSTRGIAVVVYVHGGSTPVSTTNASVVAGSPFCHAVTGGRQCTISATAPAGRDNFVIKTYDAAPAKGGFSGAKQLAIGSAAKTIAAGKANTLNVTVGGVVAAGTMALGTSSIPVIDNNTQTVTMGALDADGNVIVNDGWYDADGKAVTMALSATDASSFTFTPAKVSFASPTSSMAYNASTVTSSQVQNGFSELVSASPSNGTSHGIATLALNKPVLTEWSVTTSTSYPRGITVGPDNAIWFVENLGNQIGRIATNAAVGTHPAEYGGLTAGASSVGIAVAPDDHKLWFTEFGLGNVASIDPTSKTVTEYSTPGGSSDNPDGITAGPDGNMWFTEDSSAHSYIGKFNATSMDGGLGIIKEYQTHTTNASPTWITPGPDGKLWFLECSVDGIGTITTGASPVTNDSALTPNSVGSGGQITSGPDGALWFTEQNPNSGHSIGRSTTGGTVTLPYTFSQTFAMPTGIVTGPDGALWFTENGTNSGGGNAIGRIDPTTHSVITFSLPTTNSNPWGIVTGPDGAIWFTECLSNKIGRLQ